jgi:O-antigen ligase
MSETWIESVSGGRASARMHPRGVEELLLAILVGLLGGLGVVVMGPLPVIGGLLGVALLVMISFQGHKIFWSYLILILLGYQFLGKGFAYIGASPVYLGEVGLALAGATGLLMALFNRLKYVQRFLRVEVALLFGFIAWQFLCTIPYLGLYGVDALRDAALWGYSAFALFILLLVPRKSVSGFFDLYGKVLPYYLMWLPVAWAVGQIGLLDNVYFPGSPVPLLHLKSGDVGVHLAAAAAFMLLRIDVHGGRWSSAKLWTLWMLWLIDWVLFGVGNRAGMLSALVGVALVVLWQPRTRWYRPFIAGIFLLASLFATDVTEPFADTAQEPLGKEIIENLQSVFGEGEGNNLEGTEQWRLEWWGDIVDYTFRGEYFWSGKGYGIDLAQDDGFAPPSKETATTRNPHNASMTVLARSGVPGLVLWLLFLVSVAWMLLRRSLRRGVSANSWDRRCALWLLVYFVAFLFNSSFDVFLEGPMGGVWFWSIVGMALVYFQQSAKRAKET